MPERIAVQRLIVGEGKTRRIVMPGESVNLDSETAAILDRRDPQAVRDPRSPRPETEARSTEQIARAQVERVAEPSDESGPSASGGDNITREQAPTGGDDAPL